MLDWQKNNPVDDSAQSAGNSGQSKGEDKRLVPEGQMLNFLGLSDRGRQWIPGFFLVALICVVYLPLRHAGYVWDDDSFLTDNPVIKDAHGLFKLWFTASTPDYFPLTSSMLWLEWRLWDFHAFGYHLVNVLLHAISAVLLWRVLAILKIPGALFAATLFALHPVNVESVAWITERKNTLAMFFYVATLLCWVKFTLHEHGRWYALALISFALALLSKTAVVPLPLVLLGIEWAKGRRLDWKCIRQLLPFFLIAAALGLVTVWFQSQKSIGHDVVRTDSFFSRLAGAGWALWFYLGKALFPLNLNFIYPRWNISDRNALSYLPLLLWIGCLTVCWICRRQAWGRGLLLALGYFTIMLLPVLGFLNIFFMRYSLVADHWQYFALIGPLAFVAAIITRGFGERRWAAGIFSTGLLIVLGFLTWNQCAMYSDLETLWRTILKKNPECWMAHGNYGNLLVKENRTDEAIGQFQAALEIEPDNIEARRNLALVFSKHGKMNEAISQFRLALETKPDDVEAGVGLANCFFQMGRGDEAISQYQELLTRQPNSAIVRNNLGNTFLKLRRVDEAMAQFQKAVEIKPNFAEAENGLGACLYHQGTIDKAIGHYQRAMEINPEFEDARINLGNALMKTGKPAEAIEQFRQAARIAPADTRALNQLAWQLATCPEKALRDGKEALRIAQKSNSLTEGKDPFTLHVLAAAYAEVGQTAAAVTTTQSALDLAQKLGQQEAVGHLTAELRRYEAAVSPPPGNEK